MLITKGKHYYKDFQYSSSAQCLRIIFGLSIITISVAATFLSFNCLIFIACASSSFSCFAIFTFLCQQLTYFPTEYVTNIALTKGLV
jgi:hypothetical protein